MEKRRAHWAVTAAVEGKGAVTTPPFSRFFFFYSREQNQRNFFLNGSSSRAVASVRLRVDFVAVEEKLLCAHRIHPRFLFCAHPSLQGGMNLDRIAEAARAPPPRDVAPAFHLPRTSNSSRDTLENSSSESSDTDLAGTAPSACSYSIPSFECNETFMLSLPRGVLRRAVRDIPAV